MSLGILQEPDALSPVNNPLPIVVSSSSSTTDGFRYKIVLTADGEDVEVWIYPDTDNGYYCIYDFSMILSDMIGTNKDNWSITGNTEAYESLIDYSYTATEYIDATSGDTYSSGTFTAFKGVKQYGDFWDTEDYTMTGSTSKFLSNKISRKYKLDEYATINSLRGTFGSYYSNWDQVILDLYNGDYWVRYYFTAFGSGGHMNTIYSIPIGPANINLMSNGGLITNSGTTLPVSGDLLDATSVYYNIHLQKANDVSSETIRINLDHNCYKHDGVELLYLGDLSTYETFSARMADIKSFKTDRSEVKTNYYSINTNQYNYSIGDRGRNLVNVRSQENHKVYTDWIKDNEADDLMELFRSPDVYIIMNGYIYPIIITSSSYEEKSVRNNRLFNYTITFSMAYEKLSNC